MVNQWIENCKNKLSKKNTCKPFYLIDEARDLFEKCEDILGYKNADYNNDGENPFKNFERVEQLGICSTEKGILVRMNDKYSRICNLIDKEPNVVDEKIEDTLIDLINYSVILYLYIKYKNDKYGNNI